MTFTPGFTPYAGIIFNITNANPGVVTTFQPTNYAPNLSVRIVFPGGYNWGMNQVNGNVYKVNQLTPTTFSIDVDTTNFDTFASSTPIQFAQLAQCIPVSESGNTFNEAVKNNGALKPEYNYKNAPEPAPRP